MNVKLTKKQVRAIYALKHQPAKTRLGSRHVAKLFGVTPKTVRNIWHHKSWVKMTVPSDTNTISRDEFQRLFSQRFEANLEQNIQDLRTIKSNMQPITATFSPQSRWYNLQKSKQMSHHLLYYVLQPDTSNFMSQVEALVDHGILRVSIPAIRCAAEAAIFMQHLSDLRTTMYTEGTSQFVSE